MSSAVRRWLSVAPAGLLLSAAGCLASKSDIRLLQDELRATRAQLALGDTSILRADDARRQQIAQLSVKLDRAIDSLSHVASRLAAFQASAFAGWSVETTTPAPERRQRLAQAETYLAEAEQFSRTAKSNQAEPYLEAARAEVAAAKAKLEADVSAQPKP